MLASRQSGDPPQHTHTHTHTRTRTQTHMRTQTHAHAHKHTHTHTNTHTHTRTRTHVMWPDLWSITSWFSHQNRSCGDLRGGGAVWHRITVCRFDSEATEGEWRREEDGGAAERQRGRVLKLELESIFLWACVCVCVCVCVLLMDHHHWSRRGQTRLGR